MATRMVSSNSGVGGAPLERLSWKAMRRVLACSDVSTVHSLRQASSTFRQTVDREEAYPYLPKTVHNTITIVFVSAVRVFDIYIDNRHQYWCGGRITDELLDKIRFTDAKELAIVDVSGDWLYELIKTLLNARCFLTSSVSFTRCNFAYVGDAVDGGQVMRNFINTRPRLSTFTLASCPSMWSYNVRPRPGALWDMLREKREMQLFLTTTPAANCRYEGQLAAEALKDISRAPRRIYMLGVVMAPSMGKAHRLIRRRIVSWLREDDVLCRKMHLSPIPPRQGNQGFTQLTLQGVRAGAEPGFFMELKPQETVENLLRCLFRTYPDLRHSSRAGKRLIYRFTWRETDSARVLLIRPDGAHFSLHISRA